MQSRFTSSPTPVSLPGHLQPQTFNSSIHHESNLVAIDPLTLMISECMTISSAMRKVSRWSQSGVAAILGAGDIFGEDESITSNLGLSSNISNTNNRSNNLNDNPLLSSFLQLRSMLAEADNLYHIDSLTLLQPFLLVIKSSSTSGHITALALNSISKFITYDIISLKSKNLQSSLVQIISSLTHCRFEAADQNSDDSVLLKVLRLLELIIECPLSNLLPNEVVSEVIQTCLSLACNKRRSEVLRRAAEMAMVSITIRIFSKIKELEPESEGLDDLQTNFTETKLPEDIIGGTDASNKTPAVGTPKQLLSEVNVNESNKIDEKKEIQKPNAEETFDHEDPFDIVCINEFAGILISMISPSNQYQHMESTRVFALSLINTALEVSGAEIPRHPSLMTLVSDPISKHVLQIITTTDSPALLQAALQLFSTTAIVLGRHLKSQIELTFTLLIRSILPDTKADKKNNTTLRGNETSVSNRISASKEMLIESLSLLWTRSPIFFTNLFIDYDCDFDRSDLAITALDFLCKLSLPESALYTTDNVPPICLEGVLSFIGGINDRIKLLSAQKDSADIDTHLLIMDKNQKTSFVKSTEIMNKNPKEGIKELAKRGFITDEKDVKELAKFFFTKSVRLNKKILGEFLTKQSNAELLKEFINLFEFSDLRVDEALRILLKAFRLPGESQQIERVVELFAERYVNCQHPAEESDKISQKKEDEANEDEKAKEEEAAAEEEELEPVRPDADAVFILSYSVIMLNTDLHNPQVKSHMTLDSYKKNLRGIYYGKDFPTWYLSKIYYSIRDREIIMPEEHHGTDKWFDDAWHNLISSQASVIGSEANSDYNQKQFGIGHICQFDRVLFESIVDRLIDTLISVFKEATDDHVITRLMSSIDKCANICIYYNLSSSVDKLIGLLADLTSLTNTTEGPIISDDGPRDEIPITQIKIENKEDAITVSEMAVWFGRDFKAQLSTVVLFRLIKKTDCKVTDSWDKVLKIILNLFENCLINPNLFSDFQKKVKLNPLPKVKPRYIINRSKAMKDSGILSTFSSFLKGYSDEPPEPSDQEVESTLSAIDCVRSVNVPSIFENISRGSPTDLKLFLQKLLKSLPEFSDKSKRYFETETLFIYEVAVCFCLLLKDFETTSLVANSIASALNVSEISKKTMLRLSAYLFITLRHGEETKDDVAQKVLKSLVLQDKELSSKHGAQLVQPLISLVDDDSPYCKVLLNNDDYWKLMRTFGSNPTHAHEILPFVDGIIKSSPNDITPTNYMLILGLLDEVSSLGAIGSQWEQESEQLAGSGQKVPESADNVYFKDLVEISKKSIGLTSELASVVTRKDFEGKELSYSLVQALAHQCFNPCREIRSFAIKTLQATVLSTEISDEFTAFGIFEYGLFPLLTELSKHDVLQTDIKGFMSTQFEALSLISRVFLNYHTKFVEQQTDRAWLTILDNFIIFNDLGEKYNKSNNLIKESGIELVKNMVLVLQNGKILTEENNDLWNSSWEKIDTLYPSLKNEIAGSNDKGPVEDNTTKSDKGEKEQTVEPEETEVD